MADGGNPAAFSMGSITDSLCHAWPEVVGHKTNSVQGLIANVISQTRENLDPLTEQHLWAAVAGNDSQEWLTKYTRLRAAEKELEHMQSDKNRPLGSVGAAMDGHLLAKAEDEYIEALADHTVIDETKRADSGLQKQLQELVAVFPVIEKTVNMARVSHIMTKVVEKQPERPALSLREAFKFAGNLWKKPAPLAPQPAPN